MNHSDKESRCADLRLDNTFSTELIVILDGAPLKVNMYEGRYVTNPTNVAMIPNEDGVDQKVSIYSRERSSILPYFALRQQCRVDI